MTHALWASAAKVADDDAAALISRLRKSRALQARILVGAYGKGGTDGLRHAGSFLIWLDKSSHVPGALKRLPKFEFAEALIDVAVELVNGAKTAPNGTEIIEFWSLVWIAAMRDPVVLQSLQPRAARWNDSDVLARVEKTVAKTRSPSARAKKASQQPSEATKTRAKIPGGATPPPQKVSEVKQWLAANAPFRGAKLEVLARRPHQRAAAKAAAVRALAAIGGQGALDVLATYAPTESEGQFGDLFNDAVAKELSRAWDNFDRTAFARKVFGKIDHLWLANFGQLASLSGIEQLKWVRHLTLRVTPNCDLTPLNALPQLQTLKIEDAVDHMGLETLSRNKALTRATLVVNCDADLRALSTFPKLSHLKLVVVDESERRQPSTAQRQVFSGLVERGVELAFYETPYSKEVAEALSHHVVVKAHGFIAITKFEAHAARLEETLRCNAFPFLA